MGFDRMARPHVEPRSSSGNVIINKYNLRDTIHWKRKDNKKVVIQDICLEWEILGERDDLTDVSFKNCEFSWMTFRDCKTGGTEFIGCTFKESLVVFEDDVTFSNCVSVNTEMKSAQ